MLTADQLHSSSDDDLFSLLARELEVRLTADRSQPEFLEQIRQLPVGLRAMASTYELDVSLTLDDLGWHFGNWRSTELAEETAHGLEELGAVELANLFREAFRVARNYWAELALEGWAEWYHGSKFEEATMPLTEAVWAILEHKKHGIFDYWIAYARKHPDRIGVSGPR